MTIFSATFLETSSQRKLGSRNFEVGGADGD
jgi:hypothetical protein